MSAAYEVSQKPLAIVKPGDEGNIAVAWTNAESVFDRNYNVVGQNIWVTINLGHLTTLPIKAMHSQQTFGGDVPDELDLDDVEYFPGYPEMQQVQETFDEVRIREGRERASNAVSAYYEEWDALTLRAREEIAQAWPELRDLIRSHLLMGKPAVSVA